MSVHVTSDEPSVVDFHVICVDLPSSGVQSNWQTTVWMPPILRCRDLQPPALQDWNIEYKSMLEVKRQVVTVMKWYKTGDCKTNTHTHTYTITHNISQYHFGETPSLWEASFLEDARSAAVGSGNRKSDMLDKAQYGPMSKLTKILQKHVQPPLLSAGHGSLMMQAIHSFLVCGQISWRYSHRPIGLGFLCFALFRLGRFRGRHSSLQ